LGNWGYIEKSGKFVIPPTFSYVLDFSEGMAAVESSGKVGFVDLNGTVVVEPTYDYVTSFREGLALVAKIEGAEKSHHIQYIDKNGNVKIDVTELQLKSDPSGRDVPKGSAPNTDLALLSTRRVQNLGRIINSPTGILPEQFSDGLAVVKFAGRYGYLDKSGRVVIQPKFKEAYAFEEGVAMVGFGEPSAPFPKNDVRRLYPHVGFISKDGQFIIGPKFEDAFGFSEGLAAVEQCGKWGFVDHSGRMIILPTFNRAEPFFGGLSVVGSPPQLWP
jgi:WG containing repeat